MQPSGSGKKIQVTRAVSRFVITICKCSSSSWFVTAARSTILFAVAACSTSCLIFLSLSLDIFVCHPSQEFRQTNPSSDFFSVRERKKIPEFSEVVNNLLNCYYVQTIYLECLSSPVVDSGSGLPIPLLLLMMIDPPIDQCLNTL